MASHVTSCESREECRLTCQYLLPIVIVNVRSTRLVASPVKSFRNCFLFIVYIRKFPAGHLVYRRIVELIGHLASQLFPDAHGGFALLCIFNSMFQETDRETTKT